MTITTKGLREAESYVKNLDKNTKKNIRKVVRKAQGKGYKKAFIESKNRYHNMRQKNGEMKPYIERTAREKISQKGDVVSAPITANQSMQIGFKHILDGPKEPEDQKGKKISERRKYSSIVRGVKKTLKKKERTFLAKVKVFSRGGGKEDSRVSLFHARKGKSNTSGGELWSKLNVSGLNKTLMYKKDSSSVIKVIEITIFELLDEIS